jgi:hypothetical protein
MCGIASIVMGVFAASASAQTAPTFSYEGEPIHLSHHVETFTGPFSWENEAGGMGCSSVEFEVEFGEHEAQIIKFTPHGCTTTGLMPAFGCRLTGTEAPTATGLPWVVAPESTEEMQVLEGTIHLPQTPGCAFGADISMEAEGIRLYTVVPGRVRDLDIYGTMVTAVGEVEASGYLTGEKSLITLSE